MERRAIRGQTMMTDRLPKVAKVVMGDPAGKIMPYPDGNNIKHDFFGWVGIQSPYPYDRVDVMIAKRFNNTTYSVVANWAKRLYKKVSPGFMGLETNNMGSDVLKLFQAKYDMPYLKGIHTSGEMTEESRKKWTHMDKRFMAKYYKKTLKSVFYPKTADEEIKELLNQIAIIRESTMKADLGRHDDLYMPLLLCLNVIRLLREEADSQKHG